ncbi:hypothetical protein Tco_0621610 [Tanacetum coccineum]
MDEPLGFGYEALRRRELALGEGLVPNMFEVGQSSRSVPDHEEAERIFAFRQPTIVTWVDPEDGRGLVPSTFEVGQSSRSVPEHERAERISAFRQPTIVTWVDPEDGKWSSGSLPVSPSSPAVPSPIASPVTTPAATIAVDEDEFLEVGAQLKLHRSILYDHIHHLDALPPTLFDGYDRDLRELYTRSGAVRDEIFSQRYRFRSLKREQERATVTFNAIWRPILALEAWVGQTDAQRATLWHAIYDIQRENHDLRVQIAEKRRERTQDLEIKTFTHTYEGADSPSDLTKT